MTHDLLKDIIEQLGGRLVRVIIHSLRENTFLANVEIGVGDSLHIIRLAALGCYRLSCSGQLPSDGLRSCSEPGRGNSGGCDQS